MTPSQKSEKNFSANYHVKFGHFVNFSIFIHIFDGLISNWQINDDCDKCRLTYGGRIEGIFITGIFGYFYTKRGGDF